MTATSGGRRSRPYAATGGRTRAPDAALGIATQITVCAKAGREPLSEQHHQVLRLCPTPRAVSELAGHMELPVGVATVLIADLQAHGLVEAREPLDMSRNDNVSHALMERVLHGLRRNYENEIEGSQRAN
ncbi:MULTISPECIES: DUF742 domain-containing protein [Streptomyces]|uniref:DUF742 domain-containing protein n=1 Tax=Streptomyces TaxID=1883 RepID=UPI0002FF8D83|nr:DUF742 domain-containing protein [Streptomyces sp. AA1529]